MDTLNKSKPKEINNKSIDFDKDLFRKAILIRKVEEALCALFRKGSLNGTVHTCIGQEFSALSFCTQIEKSDFIFSNHRCHGHYMAFTGDCAGLIAEIMGRKSGICGGIGGSQHLCKDNFFTNGVQGGIVPVAAGMALANKLENSNNIGIVFIGDGTLGEGVVYETLNIVSKWKIPLLIVLENNLYAQSTPQHLTLAGDILSRPKSFDIETFEDSTERYEELFRNAKRSIDYVRNNRKPAFHLVHTYRLGAHSTGDDFRDRGEIESYEKKDPVYIFSQSYPGLYNKFAEEAEKQIEEMIKAVTDHDAQALDRYVEQPVAPLNKVTWSEEKFQQSSDRLINKLNEAFHVLMNKYEDILFIGEDILSPYGGAFKTTRGLSVEYNSRVFTTPISEAAMTGIANGLAIKGYRPFVEIMFGDFITLAFDQIINCSSKFYHMYNKQVNCPIVIRTPMGGKRGFGPTHSQTIDKFLFGIDNVTVIAINGLVDPLEIYETIHQKEKHPVIVIENKVDYGRKFPNITPYILENYHCERSSSDYPTLRFAPNISKPDVTIITYGTMIHDVFKACEVLFYEKEILAEIIVLTKISPLPIADLQSAIHAEFLFTVEEGSKIGGFGSEVFSALFEQQQPIKKVKRITSFPVPVPSSNKLEKEVLVNADMIISGISEVFSER
jgi:2-oxoisovalerate dehydrogenase E1 component